MDTKKRDLSICIVNWNTRELLKKCLESIYRNSEGLDLEVIVSDNASSDGSADMIKKKFSKAVLIKNEKNIGFGRASNRALEKSTGRFILILNPDILIEKPAFRKMITFMETNPDAGCVGCRLVNIDGSIQNSFFMHFPSYITAIIEGLMLKRIYLELIKKRPKTDQTIEVAWLAGASMLFKADLLKELGGFDKSYYMYSEDVDLCFRLKKMGLKTYYMGDVEMIHYHAASSKKKSKSYFSAVLQKESTYRFILSHNNSRNAALYRLAWIICSLARVLTIGPAYITFLPFKGRKNIFLHPLEKSVGILSWGLRLEKWTSQEIPE